MKRTAGTVSAVVSISLLLGGCATVKPQADYVRVAEHVARSTGMGDVYRPGEDERIEVLVSERFVDGLTVDEAVTIALLNNPTLQAEFFNVGVARAEVVQAGLLSNPSLGVSLLLPSGGGLANVEASLAQNIAGLWQIPVRKQAAERSLDAAILDVARRAALLAAETKRAYFAAVTAEELHGVLQENSDVSRRLATLVEERLNAGVSDQLEVNLARTAVIQAELQAESARLSSNNAFRALASLLGIPNRATELRLTDPLPAVPPKTPRDDELVRLAMASRLDVAAASELVEAAEARLRIEYRRVFPLVELGVVSERDQGEDFIFGPSLGLELPIFDQNQAQIARATFAYEQANKMLHALEQTLVQEVHGALDRVEASWRLVRMYQERSLPLAEDNLELSREAYRLGRASFLSVLEAQRFLLSSRRDYVSVLGQAASTLAELEQVVGLPLADIVASANLGNGP